MTTWALVPVKKRELAKTRLGAVLGREECAALAEQMARDVLGALSDARGIDRIVVLGTEPEVSALAAEAGAIAMVESTGGDLNQKLDKAVAEIRASGASTVMVVPADLPGLRGEDIDDLLNRHRDGVSICPAARDGGTNALIVTPPGAIPHCFGIKSARAHIAAAGARNIAARLIEHAAFAHDIDTPDDLAALPGYRLEATG